MHKMILWVFIDFSQIRKLLKLSDLYEGLDEVN